jgi:hypothetical protein
VEHATGERNRGLGLVIGFVQTQLGADIEGLVEMALQSRELGFNVIPKRSSYLDLLAIGFDTHR